jgi:hypothetical protein
MTITTVDGAIRSILLNNAAVTALVGSRVYVLELPDTCTFPAISIHKISDPYSRIKGSPRIQVSAWGEDLLITKQISTAVETALDGYAGTLGNIAIIHINPLESQDFPADNAGLYQVSYDFLVLYKK